MKRILVLFLLLFAIQVQAAGIYTTVARGTVTQANMKISAADGTAFVDKGYAYESNFSAGENGWTAVAGAVAGNIDSIGGADNWLRFTVNTTSGEHEARFSFTFAAGKRYKITLSYYIPSGQTSVAKISPLIGGYADEILGGAKFLGTQDALTTVTFYVQMAASTRTNLRIYAATSSNSLTVNDPGGDDVFYIKDVKIEENPLTDKLGHLLKIRDSSGRAIQGFIKAAGSGETLGDNLITGWTNLPDAPFGTFNTSGADITSAISATTAVGYSNNINTALRGALLKISPTLTLNSGTAPLLQYKRPVTYAGDAIISTLATGDYYRTYVFRLSDGATQDGFRVGVNSASTNFALTIPIRQVLTPSSTGVTIVSTKGGSTFNFALKNSSFNYNDSSGYTYEIIRVRQAVLMDSDACLNANATINLTDGSATWACAGIDDSAFQDGKHMITVSDATGKTVLGYYENAGSGDVVNTKLGSTNNWIWKDASFSTAGDYTRKIYYVGD